MSKERENPKNARPQGESILKSPEHREKFLEMVSLEGVFDEALVDYEKARQEMRRRSREHLIEKGREELGMEIEWPLRLSPSTLAKCLRWAFYERTTQKPLPKRPHEVVILSAGSGVHYRIAQAFRSRGFAETDFFQEDVSGRIDFLRYNPGLNCWQVFDLKTTSTWGLKQIRKKNGFYQARLEDRLQILLYIWAKRREGLDVRFGNILYVDRADGKSRKECIVFWNAAAEWEINQLLEKIEKAKEGLRRGELPEPTVGSKSAKYLCGGFCSYRHVCIPGRQELLEAEKRRKRRRRLPPVWIRRQAEKQKMALLEEAKRKAESIQLQQAPLWVAEENEE